MTVRVLRSTDVSAPVCDGSIGSLVTLLDACLVNGYGSKSSLGWTKPYSGTNKAVYRMGAGTQRYLRIEDTASTDHIAPPYIYFADGCTGVDSCTDLFKVGDNSFYLIKPDASGGWILVGDESGFILLTRRGAWGATYSGIFLGDVNSFASDPAADKGKTAIVGGSSQTVAAGAIPSNNTMYFPMHNGTTLTALAGTYLAGDLKGVSNIPAGLAVSKTVALSQFDYNIRYPSQFGGLACSPYYITHPTGQVSAGAEIRGVIPGMYYPYAQNLGFTPNAGQEFTYSNGYMSGRTLEAVYVWNTAPTPQALLLETSNTWRA